MKTTIKTTYLALALSAATAVQATPASDSEMMAHCNTYAAKHLGLTPSQIANVTYEGQRTDGTYAVNGQTTNGISFQCSFGPAGKGVQAWWHSAPAHCPSDISEANRYLYPGCD